jgi:hypothetical protein
MTKQPWASWEAVGDQSEYVTTMGVLMESLVPVFRRWLNPSASGQSLNFNWFCDAFCTSWIPLLVEAVMFPRDHPAPSHSLISLTLHIDFQVQTNQRRCGSAADARFHCHQGDADGLA